MAGLERFVHREMVLLAVLVGIAVGAFLFTRMAAQSNHEIRLRDAATWHRRALSELEAGRTAPATEALRHAVATAPEHPAYQLDLARALAAHEQFGQARQVLLRLRERQPEDAEVNLALARVEAREGDAAAAIRYYQHALAALWSDEHNEARQPVRFELIEFLLEQGQRSRALSELLVLAPTLPDDAATRVRVGVMLLAAGDPRRALDQFTAVLRLQPDHARALAGAGEAAFDLADYGRARRYLTRAPDSDARVRELLTLTDLILTRDPLAPRIGTSERRQRLATNLEYVAQRLAACRDKLGNQARSDLTTLNAELDAFHDTLRRRRTAVARDDAEEGLDLIVRLERAIDDACGSPMPLDRALELIGRRHDLGTS